MKLPNLGHSLMCVGLDSALETIPEQFQRRKHPQYEFNKWVIDQTHHYAAAYKPNLAFYEAHGVDGWRELQMTMEYLQENYPHIFTIADAKRADIGSTNQGYVKAIFDELGFDSITLHPYLGREALQPFLEREDKVSIILCRTSNPGAGELQDLLIKDKPLWWHIAQRVISDWNENNNCMLVVGATYPAELAAIRALTGMTVLVPGVGAQGGNVEAVMKVGLNSEGSGLLINSSRGIIFAADPGQAARKLYEQIEQERARLTL